MRENTPLAIAQAIHDIYGCGKTLASIGDHERRAFIEKLGISMSLDDLLEYEQRIIEKKYISAKSQDLVATWKNRLQSTQNTSEEQAAHFVNEWLNCFGTSELYNHNLLTGVTHRSLEDIAKTNLYNPTTISCWSLHYSFNGSTRYFTDNLSHETDAGELVLFKPGSSYRYEVETDGEDKKNMWILFQPRPHWSAWLGWDNLEKSTLHLKLNSKEQQQTIQPMLEELLGISQKQSIYKNEFLYNQLEKILIQANEFKAGELQYDNRIKKACDYIQKNLSRKISVDDVANACNISASWLAHLFKDQMGVSIKHWHNELRLQEAQKHLISSNQPISYIAKQLGYEDPALFTKNFKKRMNCNPTDYRQKHNRTLQ